MNTPIGKGTQTSVCPHAGKPAGVGVQAWGTVHPPASPFFFFFFFKCFCPATFSFSYLLFLFIFWISKEDDQWISL